MLNGYGMQQKLTERYNLDILKAERQILKGANLSKLLSLPLFFCDK